MIDLSMIVTEFCQASSELGQDWLDSSHWCLNKCASIELVCVGGCVAATSPLSNTCLTNFMNCNLTCGMFLSNLLTSLTNPTWRVMGT